MKWLKALGAKPAHVPGRYCGSAAELAGVITNGSVGRSRITSTISSTSSITNTSTITNTSYSNITSTSIVLGRP